MFHLSCINQVQKYVKKKVKCTVVQTLRLCTGRTAHRGSRDIALPFLDNGTRRGWGVSVTPRPLFTYGNDPVPIVQEAGWAPGTVWTGAENLAPTGIQSPARSSRSQSLYRLCYPIKICKLPKKYTSIFNDVFYLQYSHQHVSAGIPDIFRVTFLLQEYSCG